MDMLDEYRIVGNIQGYDVYTPGVSERQRDSIIATWHELPRKEELWDCFSVPYLVDRGARRGCWLRFSWDSWGASDIFGKDEVGGIKATIGTDMSRPIMLEVVVATGDDAGAGDVERFIDELYDIVLQVLHDECIAHCHGVELDFPHGGSAPRG